MSWSCFICSCRKVAMYLFQQCSTFTSSKAEILPLLLCLPAHTQADSTRAGKTLFLLSTLLHPREADKITRERRRSHRTDATACCTTVSTDFPAAASLQPVTEISWNTWLHLENKQTERIWRGRGSQSPEQKEAGCHFWNRSSHSFPHPQRAPPHPRSSSPQCVTARRLRTPARPRAMSCNMRYESGAEVLAAPQVTECTRTNSSSKVNTERIYLRLRLHGCAGTSRLPTAVFPTWTSVPFSVCTQNQKCVHFHLVYYQNCYVWAKLISLSKFENFSPVLSGLALAVLPHSKLWLLFCLL